MTGRLDDWFEYITLRSGLATNAATMLIGSAAVAILAGMAASMGGLEMPIPILVGLSGFGSLWLFVYVLAVRRKKKFVEHFPAAIDMLARSVQAGESFEEAIETASRAVADPVAGELKRLSQELGMGMQVSASMANFAQRSALTDVKIFANTISLHREMGGQLGNTLSRLAAVIRLRSDYLRKIQSATSLGRFAAIGITFAGLFVLGYMWIVHPEYINRLWGSELGMKMVYYGIASELVGLVWVAITLKQEF